MTSPLIRNREATSRAFVRDLRSFLGQPPEVLLAISDLGDVPRGFRATGNAEILNERFTIPLDAATGNLHIAEYIYDRVVDLGLNADEAVSQLASVALELEDPIEIDVDKRNAIVAILSFKRAYEATVANRKALANAPHFTGVSGSWSVKSVTMSNGEAVRVPVLSLSVTWHDGPGNNKEAFFQMSNRDWERFNNSINAIGDGREDIEGLL